MRRIIQLACSLVFWCIIINFNPNNFVLKPNGVAIIPLVCVMFAILGTLFPKLFGMGVQEFKEANVVEKMLPILVVVAICYGMSYMPQTYATAVFLSMLVGNTSSYLFYLIGGVKLCKGKRTK